MAMAHKLILGVYMIWMIVTIVIFTLNPDLAPNNLYLCHPGDAD